MASTNSTSSKGGLAAAFRAILIPAAIYQIILIGPGFSTGREVVEYAGQFGALGVWTLLVVLVGFAVVNAVGFEFARVTRTYNYREYIRELLGRVWPIFDVLWVAFSVLVIGIVTSAVGETLGTVFDLPYLVAVIGMLAIVAIVLLFGRRGMERFELGGSILFSLGITVFAVFVLVSRWDHVVDVFASGDASLAAEPGVGNALLSGLLYVGYNASTFIAALFCLDRQRTRTEAMGSGVFSAILVIIPFGLTYLAVLSFYQPGVVDAEIPWLELFERTGSQAFSIVFAVAFFVAVVATAVGLIHAFLRRVDSALMEGDKPELPMRWRAVVIIALLAAAFLLAQVGIIALVAQGYTYFAYAFLLVLVLPLLTKGVYRLLVSRADGSVGGRGGRSSHADD